MSDFGVFEIYCRVRCARWKISGAGVFFFGGMFCSKGTGVFIVSCLF